MSKVLLLDYTMRPLHLVGWDRAMNLIAQRYAEPFTLDGSETPVTEAKIIRLLSYRPHKDTGEIIEREAVPDFVKLKGLRNDRVPKRVLFARDKWACSYCGVAITLTSGTKDHVKPKDAYKKEGLTAGHAERWDNVTTACKKCNGKKANRLPHVAKMYPRTAPRKPGYVQTLWAGRAYHPIQAEYVAMWFNIDPSELTN